MWLSDSRQAAALMTPLRSGARMAGRWALRFASFNTMSLVQTARIQDVHAELRTAGLIFMQGTRLRADAGEQMNFRRVDQFGMFSWGWRRETHHSNAACGVPRPSV